MGIEIKTFSGSIAQVAQDANAYLGAKAFDDTFLTAMALTSKAEGLSHLVLSVAKVSDKQFVCDYMLTSAIAMLGLEMSGKSAVVTGRTEKTVRKQLKKLRLA